MKHKKSPDAVSGLFIYLYEPYQFLMKRYIPLFFFFLMPSYLFAQNQIRIRGGLLSTNTSVSEYNRGLEFFYYDSVTLNTRRSEPQANIDIDFDLGKRVFLTTGLGYSKKGIPRIYYVNGDYWYAAKQEYIGMNVQLKYHYRFRDKRIGLYGAAGFKTDFAVGGPNGAQIATDEGSQYFHAFGFFNQIDFSMQTVVGFSYHLGPGDLVLDANFQKGLSDIISDKYIVGRTFSIGICLGYSLYLSN